MKHETDLKQMRQQLESLHRKYYQFLCKKALAITQDFEDAEDAVHNVYLRLLQGQAPAGKFARNPKAWFVEAVRFEAHSIVEDKQRAGVIAVALG